MKHMIKRAVCFALAACTLAAVSCSSGEEDITSENSSESITENITEKVEYDDMEFDDCKVVGLNYTTTELSEKDLKKWESERGDSSKQRDGIIVSPYFTLKINGQTVPVFAARTAKDAHSFAYVEVSDLGEDGKFRLDVEVTNSKERVNPVVLPESAGVTAVCEGIHTYATITEYGSYSFTFDKDDDRDGSSHPLTLMVKAPEELVVPEGYQVKEIKPGEHNYNKTKLYNKNTVYVFKAGQHIIEMIEVLTSNVIVYFEPGTLLTVKNLTLSNGKPTCAHMLRAHGVSNVKFIGHAAIDMSHVYEGKSVIFDFENLKDFEIAGLTSIDSAGWTFTFSTCRDVVVRDLLILAYKTCSDGVLLSDCANVNVSGCFVRTGDDAMEVKSTTGGSVRTDNVVFENNAVWTDKGIGYGAVYEDNFSQSNVIWRNNSIGYALANWSSHLGCTTISMSGNNGTSVDSDMHFENIEIYYTRCPLFTIHLENGGIVKDIYLKNISVKYKKLNGTVSTKMIDFICAQSKTKSGYVIGNIYLDNINVKNKLITEENKTDFIALNFNEKNVDFSIDNVFVNTLK